MLLRCVPLGSGRSILPSRAKFAHYATSSDGNNDESSGRISFTNFPSVSAEKETTDEKQAQHFGQSQM
jgi:hypothetical protein